MKCKVYCTALSYELRALQDLFEHLYKIEKIDTVLYLEIPLDNGETSQLFFFSYGTFVTWHFPDDKLASILESIKPFENHPLSAIEIDEYTYNFGKKAFFKNDEITLPNDLVELKIAFSHALAQSAKLSTFELTIQNIFKKNKHLPEHLAEYGTIPLSRRKIRQQMGRLFLERSAINLNLDVLDTPNFFWEHPHLESLYLDMAAHLDLEERTESLNQQLDVLHDLFEMLGSELNDQHSHRLEWAIIYLIIIEVVLLLFHDVLKLI